jgi:NitT/TauT family transport system ATP-binding protein
MTGMGDSHYAITARGLEKKYGENEVLGGLDLAFERGKITAIFGPNGCGKSTLLNVLAGIVRLDGGGFEIEDFRYSEFGYLFQDYRDSLFPWRNNRDNLAFPLQIQGVAEGKITERVRELERTFSFRVDPRKHPHELSGGQQQILAFMRAVVADPKLLFIDEPFSALDYENNLLLRGHLQEYFLDRGPTIVLVTHDVEEAVHLADKIVVLSRKPTRVAEVVDNPLPYPRKIQTIEEREFRLVEDKVLSAFKKAANL